MLSLSPVWKKRLIAILAIIVVAGTAIAVTAWYKFFRQVDDGPFASAEERFKYGSIGAEADAGLPYWIWS
jgi:hypothetical protein